MGCCNHDDESLNKVLDKGNFCLSRPSDQILQPEWGKMQKFACGLMRCTRREIEENYCLVELSNTEDSDLLNLDVYKYKHKRRSYP